MTEIPVLDRIVCFSPTDIASVKGLYPLCEHCPLAFLSSPCVRFRRPVMALRGLEFFFQWWRSSGHHTCPVFKVQGLFSTAATYLKIKITKASQHNNKSLENEDTKIPETSCLSTISQKWAMSNIMLAKLFNHSHNH